MSRFFLLALMCLSACSSGSTGPSPPPSPPPPPPPSTPLPVVTTSVTPEAVEVGSGTEVVISWSSRYADSCSGFWSENTLPTSGSHRFTPTTTIARLITCTGAGGQGSDAVSIQVVEPPHLRLEFLSAGNQLPVSNLSIRLRSGSWDSTVPISAGAIDISMPLSVRSRLSGDSMDVVVDRVNSAERDFIPLVGRIERTRALSGQSLTVVLSPLQWKITCGPYAGNQVPVSIHKAYIPVGDGMGFFQTSWFWEHFPRFLAIDRAESNVPIGTADSIAMWSKINEIEARTCLDLFKPGDTSQVLAEGGVRIRVRSDHPVIGNAGAGRKDVNSPYLYWGVTTFREVASLSAPLLEHELTHILGFGHTCAWPTVMVSGCVNGEARLELSPEDIAYFHLFYSIRKLEVERAAVLGLAASLRGEREIMLGLLNSPDSPSSVRVENLSVPEVEYR